MPIIDRYSVEDAKRIAEKFLKDDKIRKSTLSFLSDAITYADELDRENWNLNLDKDGNFIRFNIGQVYCIEIFKDKVNVICIKELLKESINGRDLDLQYKGYDKKKKVISNNLNSVPDCLSKVPDSVACYIKHENLKEYLPILKRSNQLFIDYAIRKSSQLPTMRNAHSIGFLKYLSDLGLFNDVSLMSESRYIEIQQIDQKDAKILDDQKLKLNAEKAKKIPMQITVEATRYVRDQNVVEFTKRNANGICQDCHQPAPFKIKSTGEPFLETHHIIPLSEEGEDTIENTVALCPNCHRKRHYG